MQPGTRFVVVRKSAQGVRVAMPRSSRSDFVAYQDIHTEQGFDLRLVPEKLTDPLRWSTSRMIFVNSMSDMFHDDVPDDYILAIAEVMRIANWHTYQVLTKRAERLRYLLHGKLVASVNMKRVENWTGAPTMNFHPFEQLRDRHANSE